VNGVPVTFTVDTGATDLVLSREDARRAGIDPDDLAYLGAADTANGTVRTARVTLEQGGPGGHRGPRRPRRGDGRRPRRLAPGLSYLHLFSRIEIADGALVLTR
jgi:aspartyl protease family protein